MEIAFDIHGDVPSKKNSRRSISVGRMRFSIPGEYHESWHKEASREMRGYRFEGSPYDHALVEITVYPKSARRSDLSNKCESVMDLLVDSGVLTDDNWYVVPELKMKFGGVDKSNPRASVILKL